MSLYRRNALLALALAFWVPDSARATDKPPTSNVLILVLDACRADKLGCYGYERPTSPVIDSIAADPDATLFHRYYVQAPWTKPSTASLFTGLFVHQHGLILGHESKDKTTGSAVFATQALSAKLTTMAEHFDNAGFYTFSVVGHSHLAKDYGFAQGFNEYVRTKNSDDEKKVEALLSAVRRSPGRFFGYVHLKACHNPFRPKERDSDLMDRFGFEYDEATRAAAGVDFGKVGLKFAIKSGSVSLDENDTRFLRLVYDAKLRTVDRELVAPIIDGLKQAGRYDDTLLIVTADHGEALYEHRDYAHKGHLWETVVRVPLIVKFPRGHRPAALGREFDGLARSIDLLPSLLTYIGQPVPDGLPGISLFESAAPRFTLAQNDDGWALLRDGFKLIRTGDRVRLFDLTRDPGEQSDLAATQPAHASRLDRFAAALFAETNDLPAAPLMATPLEGEILEDLRSLGYVE